MSSSGRRRMEEAPVPEGQEESDAARPKRSGNRRSSFPTPGFKSFGTALNLLAVPFASWQLSMDVTVSVIVLTLLAVLGSGIALYSNALRPLATNVKTRKILTAVSLAYGFLVLVALALTLII